MSLILSSSYIQPILVNHFSVHEFQRKDPSDPYCTTIRCSRSKLFCGSNNISIILRNKLCGTKKPFGRQCMRSSNEFFGEENTNSDVWRNEEEEENEDFIEEDIGTQWEGAVVYQRNPSVSHIEYCTTLEKLGLGALSTEVSKSRASSMGLRITKAVKDYPFGTPVIISVDVARKKQKLRLDGIIKTVITLGCNRCGEPAAECVFSNFSLLLIEEPIEEPEVIDMGVIYGADKFRTSSSTEVEEDDDEGCIDMDDRLYFPPDIKTIDISKNIRDMVHLEITVNALCDPSCKGLCLKCGTNLNTRSCSCDKQAVKDKSNGPFGGLRQKIHLT